MATSEKHTILSDQQITKLAKKIPVSKIKTLAVSEMKFSFDDILRISDAKEGKAEETTREILCEWRNKTSKEYVDQIQVSFIEVCQRPIGISI